MFIPTTNYNANKAVPEAGQHIATITEIQDIGTQGTKFGPKAQLRIIFTLDESGATVTKKVTKTGSMSGNLYAIAAELHALPPGGGVQTDLLLGKRCIVETTKFTGQNGEPCASVAKVLAMDGQRPRPQQAFSSPYSQPRQTFHAPGQYQQPYQAPPPQSNLVTQSNPISDDDIPF